MAGKQDSWNGWRERIAALRNVPAVLRIVWESGRTVVVLGVVFRVVASVLPLGLLWITKLIIDILVRAHTTHEPVGTRLWWLVAAEFSLAVFGSVVSRGVDFLDALLADKYTRHVSVLVMKHAAQLDLTAYEDPVFYDRLERARVQATDRLGMIQSIGRLVQQVITTVSLSVAIMLFSPWLLLMLVACVVPAFLGESHFAFLGYAKNFRQTPIRRQLDYLRVLGGSKEAAKELKLFGLAPFLTERFSRLSNQIYEEDVDLARRRLTAGSFLSMISTAGYYLAYVFVIWRTVIGVLSIGDVYFSCRRDSAGQFEYPADFFNRLFHCRSSFILNRPNCFFRDATDDRIEAECFARAAADYPRIRISQRFISLSWKFPPGSGRIELSFASGRASRADRRKWRRENNYRQAAHPALRSSSRGRCCWMESIFVSTTSKTSTGRSALFFRTFMRYEMTARENIAVGRIEQLEDLPLLRQSAQKSMADEVVGRLPRGYEQMLGRRFDGGVDLSGGEWQKVALARAYLRDAQILILDEPTAALDARSEYEVFQRFAELTAGKDGAIYFAPVLYGAHGRPNRGAGKWPHR